MTHSRRIAVIGGGWAGAAAALTLTRAGRYVHVFEASRIPGGRARAISHDDRVYDNGQHLLLGAYQRSLALIASVQPLERSVTRLPLSLRAVGNGAQQLALTTPPLPSPWHLLAAFLSARGLSITDRLATLRWADRVLRSKQAIAGEATVSTLLATQPAAPRALLWEPLCVAALNTPADIASASVLVEVLRRSFLGERSDSDLIIPSADLSQLFPVPALAEVAGQGSEVTLGTAVRGVRVERAPVGRTRYVLDVGDREHAFEQLVIATGPQHVARLLSPLVSNPVAVDALGNQAVTACEQVMKTLQCLTYEPITTIHFEFLHRGAVRSHPAQVLEHAAMLMLDGQPGQWLFWHRLASGHWRASVVISAHRRTEDARSLVDVALRQLRAAWNVPAPVWQTVVTEKRATYACTPANVAALKRLPTAAGHLHFAGDWTYPTLPATLEAAVISGERAAHAIINEKTQ